MQVDEEELLEFAETVNFDEYINDLEFRTALAVMKVRVLACEGWEVASVVGSGWKAE